MAPDDTGSGRILHPIVCQRAAGGGAERPTLEPEDLDEVGAESEPENDALTGYVVSVVGKRRFRRLHHLSKCGLIPGRDGYDYTVHGQDLPAAKCYDDVCARCWRTREAFDAEMPSASSSGESDSSRENLLE